jgi:hypothetical protein
MPWKNTVKRPRPFIDVLIISNFSGKSEHLRKAIVISTP